MKDSYIDFTFVNTNFDFNDYEKPVKTFLDNSLFSHFSRNISKYYNMYIQKRTYSALDSIFQFFNSEQQHEFVGVDRTSLDASDLDPTHSSILILKFVLDNYERNYERQVYSLLAFTGDIGGVFQILEVLGALLVFVFTKNLFMYRILSQMYQIDNSKISKKLPTKEVFNEPISDELTIYQHKTLNMSNYQI